MRLYPLLHRWANRARQTVGRPVRPKRCCREGANLGTPFYQHGPHGRLTIRQCAVCDCKHYEMDAETGALGVRQA